MRRVRCDVAVGVAYGIIDSMSHIAEGRRNRSVLKAISVLDAFRPGKPQMTAADIGKRTGLSRGSLYPILYALEHGGYLRRAEDGRAYAIGFRVVELANLVFREVDIQESVRPVLEALAVRLQVNAHLGILHGVTALHLYREIGAEAVVVGEIVGWQAPAYCTALGKSLLAQLEPARREDLLRTDALVAHTSQTTTEVTALIQETERIAASGVAISLEEYHEGIVGIAAPVRDAAGDACCAVSISVTRARFDREESDLVEAVKQAACDISDKLHERGITVAMLDQTKPRAQ